jgi:hypothetical protein
MWLLLVYSHNEFDKVGNTPRRELLSIRACATSFFTSSECENMHTEDIFKWNLQDLDIQHATHCARDKRNSQER